MAFKWAAAQIGGSACRLKERADYTAWVRGMEPLRPQIMIVACGKTSKSRSAEGELSGWIDTFSLSV